MGIFNRSGLRQQIDEILVLRISDSEYINTGYAYVMYTAK